MLQTNAMTPVAVVGAVVDHLADLGRWYGLSPVRKLDDRPDPESLPLLTLEAQMPAQPGGLAQIHAASSVWPNLAW